MESSAKKRRQWSSTSPCWWTANGKECFKGDRCAFKHMVPQVKGQPASKTGVSPQGLVTERDGNRTKVPPPRPVAKPMPRPSATPEFQGSAASVLCLSEEQELKEDPARDYWIKCWDECSSSDSLVDGGNDDSHCDSGADVRYRYLTGNSWRSGHWKMDSWHLSHWKTSDWHRKDGSYHGCDGTWSKHHVYDGWNSSHWNTSGWCQENERYHDHDESQWFTHAFFAAQSVDQLINSLHMGGESTTIFTCLEVYPGESLADTAAQSGIIDLRPFRKAEEALFNKFGLKLRVIHSNNQAVGIGGKAKVLGKVEMPSGMGGANGVVTYTVVDSPGVSPVDSSVSVT